MGNLTLQKAILYNEACAGLAFFYGILGNHRFRRIRFLDLIGKINDFLFFRDEGSDVRIELIPVFKAPQEKVGVLEPSHLGHEEGEFVINS